MMGRFFMKKLTFSMLFLLGYIIASLSLAAEKMKSFVITCDDTKVELTCTKQNETGCLASKLSFQPKGMPEHIIKLPKEIKEASYYAAGLSCTANPKKEHYIVVQFGELPYGCKVCEFYYLYDISGNVLTKSEPLFLTEPREGSPRGSLNPNNKEFDAIFKKLELKWNELEYL